MIAAEVNGGAFPALYLLMISVSEICAWICRKTETNATHEFEGFLN